MPIIQIARAIAVGVVVRGQVRHNFFDVHRFTVMGLEGARLTHDACAARIVR